MEFLLKQIYANLCVQSLPQFSFVFYLSVKLQMLFSCAFFPSPHSLGLTNLISFIYLHCNDTELQPVSLSLCVGENFNDFNRRKIYGFSPRTISQQTLALAKQINK